MIKISIVIPVYNGEKYIAECIESCLNQRGMGGKYEIIIVNDGSTDKTKDIINGYRQNYQDIITVVHKKNGGTASALNIGLELMKGEWFKWLSADDKLLPNTLSHMLAYIECSRLDQPYKYLYYTDYQIIDESGNYLRTFNEPDRTHLTPDEMAAEQFFNFYGNGSTSLMHKSAFHIVGKFREGMPYNDDYEFWLRWCLIFKFEFHHIPFVGIQYRVHDNSLTSTKDYKRNKILVEMLRSEFSKELDVNQRNYLKSKRPTLRKRIIKMLPDPLVQKLLEMRK